MDSRSFVFLLVGIIPGPTYHIADGFSTPGAKHGDGPRPLKACPVSNYVERLQTDRAVLLLQQVMIPV